MAQSISKTLRSRSSETTQALGREIGRKAYPGMTILLNGDLGSGKTTFTQGLAQGLSVPPDYPVTSPTYTLINEYPGRMRLFHVDLYRLPPGSELEDIGLYDILGAGQAVVIEWADRMLAEDLPDQRIEIKLAITDADNREIALSAYGLEASDLLKSLRP